MDSELARRDFEAAERELLTMLNMLREMRGEPALAALPAPPYCNFCGKGKAEVSGLVEGLNAHICEQCASEALRLLRKG
jgi:hypothetical protein